MLNNRNKIIKDIKSTIRKLRIENGFTYREMAKKCGLKIGTNIYHWEATAKGFSVATLIKLANAYNCKLKIEFIPINEDNK